MTQMPSKKFKLLSLILIFALPVILSTGVYLGSGYFNLTPSSQGLLLDPPLTIEKLDLRTVSQDPVKPAAFAESWWLIYVAPPHCAEICALQMAKLRSVHMALNKNISRVKRLMLIEANTFSPDQLQEAEQDKQATIDYVQNPEYLLGHCQRATTEGIFLMDPLGNIMMCYGPTQEAHAILQDMEKLLKASRIG